MQELSSADASTRGSCWLRLLAARTAALSVLTGQANGRVVGGRWIRPGVLQQVVNVRQTAFVTDELKGVVGDVRIRVARDPTRRSSKMK